MPVEKREWKENENSKSSLKWIIGIALAIALLAGGGYLVYKFWPKKSPEQVQQEESKKQELLKQIKLIQAKIAESKIALEKKKAGQEYQFEIFTKPFPEVIFSNPDKEIQELQNKKAAAWKEYCDLHNEIANLVSQQNQQINDKALTDWNKQKNGQWMVLTEKLGKDLEVKDKLNQFIITFYHRYKETKKNSIPAHPAFNFKGFDGFYISEKDEKITEMGNCHQPENDKGSIQTIPNLIIKDYPSIVGLNQLYLLNNGRNPSGAMDRFYSREPQKDNISYLDIGFDKLINTIAHEIAHSFQTAKNISEDKITDTRSNIINFEMMSDCMESGEGKRDDDYNLIKPENPELVYEHKKFEKEIEQMILVSNEYKEFERWWKATS